MTYTAEVDGRTVTVTDEEIDRLPPESGLHHMAYLHWFRPDSGVTDEQIVRAYLRETGGKCDRPE